MAKNVNVNYFGLFIFVIVLSGLIIILLFALSTDNELDKLNFGNSSPEFCSEKCGDMPLLSSINNTDYNIIKCECVSGKKEPQGYMQSANVKKVIYYFDSLTLEEMSKREVLQKLEKLS